MLFLLSRSHFFSVFASWFWWRAFNFAGFVCYLLFYTICLWRILAIAHFVLLFIYGYIVDADGVHEAWGTTTAMRCVCGTYVELKYSLELWLIDTHNWITISFAPLLTARSCTIRVHYYFRWFCLKFSFVRENTAKQTKYQQLTPNVKFHVPRVAEACVCVLCGRPKISHFAPHNRGHTHTHATNMHHIIIFEYLRLNGTR